MVRQLTGEPEKSQERVVEAEIIKNTSVAGMLLHRGSRHMLPFTLAKALRNQGLARPIPKVIPSHPVAPPPPPPVFEGESGEDEEEEVDSEDDEE